MSTTSLIVKDIERLLDECTLYYEKEVVYDESMSIEALLEFKEQLELEVALLKLQSYATAKTNSFKVNKSQNKLLKKELELTKTQRLCLKFLKDPHTFFADSKNSVMKLISVFIPKYESNV